MRNADCSASTYACFGCFGSCCTCCCGGGGCTLLLLLPLLASARCVWEDTSSPNPHFAKVDAVEEGRAAAADADAAADDADADAAFVAVPFFLLFLLPVPPPDREQHGRRNHPQELSEGHGRDLPVSGRIAREAGDDGAAKVDGGAAAAAVSSASCCDGLRAPLRHSASELRELEHRRSAELRREAARAGDEGDLLRCCFLFGRKKSEEFFFSFLRKRTKKK